MWRGALSFTRDREFLVAGEESVMVFTPSLLVTTVREGAEVLQYRMVEDLETDRSFNTLWSLNLMVALTSIALVWILDSG